MRKKAKLPLTIALVIGLVLSPVLFTSKSASAYTIVEGETLTSISATFGIDMWELAEINGIENPDKVLAGQTLVIPDGSSSTAGAPAAEHHYIIQAGDTLSELAEAFEVTAATLIQANGLADPDFLIEGQTIVISDPSNSGLVRPSDLEMEALLEQFALIEGIDPGLVKALAYQESGWQQGVTSITGALGIMQIQPETGQWLEQEVFGHRLDIEYSAHDNIKAGVRYLSILLVLTGNAEQALAAYYQGYNAVGQGILYDGTAQYVANVLAIKDVFWP